MIGVIISGLVDKSNHCLESPLTCVNEDRCVATTYSPLYWFRRDTRNHLDHFRLHNYRGFEWNHIVEDSISDHHAYVSGKPRSFACTRQEGRGESSCIDRLDRRLSSNK
jgi:hypothetical protein